MHYRTCLFYKQETVKNVATLSKHMNITNDLCICLDDKEIHWEKKEIIKNRCLVDINQINIVYNWLREKNYRYTKMPELSECPTTIFLKILLKEIALKLHRMKTLKNISNSIIISKPTVNQQLTQGHFIQRMNFYDNIFQGNNPPPYFLFR